MAVIPSRRALLTTILCISSLFSRFAQAQVCNTNQNPSCAGVAAFQALCCPYPSLCYYRDRYGAVGCCPAGQVCGYPGGTYVTATVPKSVPYTTITSTYSIVHTSSVVTVTLTTSVVPVVPVSTPVVTITATTASVVPTTNPLVTITTTAGGAIALINDAADTLPQNVLIAIGLLVAVVQNV